MSLVETFEALRSSIVALCIPPRGDIRVSPPAIVGTGFVVDSRGLVATNRHVIEELRRHAPKGAPEEKSAYAIIFGKVRPSGEAYAQSVVQATIRRILQVKELQSRDRFYAPVPDLAFVTVDTGDLPAVTLAPPGDHWKPGLDIATAGYALGSDGLLLDGAMNQFAPFLRKGVISSVFPFPGPSPHGFTIDIPTQGGESGSPIFRCQDGVVLGVLYAGFEGTNITFGLPSSILSEVIHQVISHFKISFDDVKSWAQLDSAQDFTSEPPGAAA